MRTKHLIALAAVIAATTYATSAHAGVSFQVSVGWPAPVCVQPVYAPAYPPPVIVAPPPRVVCTPTVVVGKPCRPVYAPVRVYSRHHWRYERPHGQPGRDSRRSRDHGRH